MKKDSLPKIINNLNKKKHLQFLDLNGKIVDGSSILGLDPEGIESFDRKIVTTDNEWIFVKTRKDYIPELISVKNLLTQYNFDSKNSLILIDGQPVIGDSKKVFFDRNYILQIKAESVHSEENKSFALVSIYTKSKKNLDQAKEQVIK